MLGWTTVSDRGAAERLAAEAVESGLAVCVQVDGPVASQYRWQGKLERAEEFRLAFKFLPGRTADLEAWILRHHPYETPEWVAIRADRVGEKYLSWARSTGTPRPF